MPLEKLEKGLEVENMIDVFAKIKYNRSESPLTFCGSIFRFSVLFRGLKIRS